MFFLVARQFTESVKQPAELGHRVEPCLVPVSSFVGQCACCGLHLWQDIACEPSKAAANGRRCVWKLRLQLCLLDMARDRAFLQSCKCGNFLCRQTVLDNGDANGIEKQFALPHAFSSRLEKQIFRRSPVKCVVAAWLRPHFPDCNMNLPERRHGVKNIFLSIFALPVPYRTEPVQKIMQAFTILPTRWCN